MGLLEKTAVLMQKVSNVAVLVGIALIIVFSVLSFI